MSANASKVVRLMLVCGVFCLAAFSEARGCTVTVTITGSPIAEDGPKSGWGSVTISSSAGRADGSISITQSGSGTVQFWNEGKTQQVTPTCPPNGSATYALKGTAASAAVDDVEITAQWKDNGGTNIGVPGSDTMTVVRVELLTAGELQIVQDPDEDSVKIIAEVTPGTLHISWTESGPGKNYVNTSWVNSGSECTATVKLDDFSTWLTDSIVTLTAHCTECPDAQSADKTVPMKKFTRDYNTAYGSQDVVLELSFSEASIGWNCTLCGVCITAAELDNDEITVDIDRLGKTGGNFEVYYQSDNDEGDGTWILHQVDLEFEGYLDIVGDQKVSGWPNSTATTASMISAGVDGNAVDIVGGALCHGFRGTPLQVTFNMGVTLKGESVEVSGGHQVTFTIQQCDPWDIERPDEAHPHDVKGTYNVTGKQGDHNEGQNMGLNLPIKIAASSRVEQSNSKGWHTFAYANNMDFTVTSIPVELAFRPDL